MVTIENALCVFGKTTVIFDTIREGNVKNTRVCNEREIVLKVL